MSGPLSAADDHLWLAVQEAGPDPLRVLQLVYPVLASAQENATWNDAELEYVEALLRLAAWLTETIADQTETDWRDVLEVLGGMLDRRDFERQVGDDLRNLPEYLEPSP